MTIRNGKTVLHWLPRICFHLSFSKCHKSQSSSQCSINTLHTHRAKKWEGWHAAHHTCWRGLFWRLRRNCAGHAPRRSNKFEYLTMDGIIRYCPAMPRQGFLNRGYQEHWCLSRCRRLLVETWNHWNFSSYPEDGFHIHSFNVRCVWRVCGHWRRVHRVLNQGSSVSSVLCSWQ